MLPSVGRSTAVVFIAVTTGQTIRCSAQQALSKVLSDASPIFGVIAFPAPPTATWMCLYLDSIPPAHLNNPGPLDAPATATSGTALPNAFSAGVC